MTTNDQPPGRPASPQAEASLEQVAAGDNTLWSFTGIELIEISDTLTLLLDPASEKRLLVQKEVGITLTHCEPYRTLREHAEYLVTTLPQLGGQVAPVIPVLEQIRDAGLMREAARVVTSLATSAGKTALPPVQVFIITCDRPAAVERLLHSMEGNTALELPEAFTLIDDSRDITNRENNRALVEAHNAKGSFQLNYFGMEARERLIAHLIQTEPDLEGSIRFLLDREAWGGLPTYGLSRTLALLLGVGKRVLVFDDDVLCQAVRAPLPVEPIQFGGITGRKAVFWGSSDDQLAAKQTLNDSPIALMTRQLGAALADGLGSLSHGKLKPEALKGANGAFIRSLSPQSRILQTQCSTWGDPGTGSGHWISELDMASIDRLLAVPEGLVATVDARASWLGYGGPTLTKHGVMSQLSGYDASHLLPPFMPAFRGEDGLFAFMLLTLHPDSLVLNHAWAIPHHPLEARESRSLRAPIPPQGGMALLTRWIGDNVTLGGGLTPEKGLIRMAQGIQELASLPDADIRGFANAELARWQASQVAHFKRQLKRAPDLQSRNWQHYIERGHEEAFAALQKPPSWSELLAYPTEDAAHTLALVRRGGQQLANALEAWPSLWRAAQRFKEGES